MFSIKPYAMVGVFAAAALFSSPSAHALGLSAGPAAARAGAENPALVEVQYQERRSRVRRGQVAHQPRPARRSASNRHAVAAGLGAVAAIGVIGAVAAANARPARQHYHQQPNYHPAYQSHSHHYDSGYHHVAAPVCRMRNEELYNRNGVYRGVYQVRVCH